MKNFWILLLTSIGLLNGVVDVQAQNVTEGNQASQRHETFSKVEDLMQSLTSLNEVGKFRVEVDWINQRSKEMNVKMTVLGDNLSGNALITLQFFNKHTNPKAYEVTFYVYDHFKQVYVSSLSLLDQLQFFQKLPITLNDITHYKESFVEVSNQNITQDLSQDLLQNLFLLIPNQDKLISLGEDQIYQAGETYLIGLWRREIPEYFFSGQKSLDLQFKLDYDVDENQLGHSLQLSSKTPGLSVATQVAFGKRLADNTGEAISQQEALYDQVPGLKGKLLLEKLTEVRLYYNKKSQEYKLKIAGLTENFNLNIFTAQTANFKTYEFESNLTYRPEEWEMPDISKFSRVSEQELNYLLDQWGYEPYNSDETTLR